MCSGGVHKECYRNSRKRDADGQLIKNKVFMLPNMWVSTYQFIRKRNLRFTYIDINGKRNGGLSLCQTVELVW